MTIKYDPTAGMTPFDHFIGGFGGGFQTNLDDWKTLLALHRPTTEEETERVRTLSPVRATPFGGAGYDIGAMFPLPPLRQFVPTFFREGQDADAIARRKQFQDELRAKMLHRLNPAQMTPPDVDSMRKTLSYEGYLPTGKGLLGL